MPLFRVAESGRRGDQGLTPMGKPPPLAVRLEKALPFRRWVAARASCGGATCPRPHPNPKHNAESDGQEAHHTMRKSVKRGRGATYASQPQERCPLVHPLQGASCLSTPLQGGILKPPALRVVDDFILAFRRSVAKKFSSSECLTPAFVQFSAKNRLIFSASGASLLWPRTTVGRRI